MPAFTQMLRAVTPEKFAEIFAASTRKARETYFHRLGVRKAKQTNRVTKLSVQHHERAIALYEVLREQEDDELCKEVLQTWLLTKRELLADALDHLGVAHQNGLTESDELDGKFEKMGAADVKAMVKALTGKNHDKVEIALYLKFMGAEADKVDAK